MHQYERRRYEMLVRVRDFSTAYGHLFPESTVARQAFATVTAAVEDIETHDTAATAASVSRRAASTQDARRALQDRLVLVAKTARALPEADVGFKAHFHLPDWLNDQRLLTTARQFVERAGAVSAEFLAHGMAPTFVADLNALITRFEAARRHRPASGDQRVAARTGLKQTLATASRAVAQLDVVIANHLASDPVVREVWNRSRRTGDPPRRRRTRAANAPARASAARTADGAA